MTDEKFKLIADEVPFEIQLAYAEQEKQGCQQNLYVLSMRYRLNKKMGNDAAAEQMMTELEKYQAGLDECKAIIKEIKLAQRKAEGKPSLALVTEDNAEDAEVRGGG